MKSNIIALVCGLFVTGLVNAATEDCPASLSKEELIKCQKEAEKHHKHMTDSSQSDSAVSPITGKNVKSMSPAAGQKAKSSK